MNYDHILIRYGEISTKGRNRNKFVDKLRKSVRIALAPFPKVKIRAERDRMYVKLNGEDAQEINKALKNIFGIQSFSPAIKVKRDIEQMKVAALVISKKPFTKRDKPLK